jgi:hypothetical protein
MTEESCLPEWLCEFWWNRRVGRHGWKWKDLDIRDHHEIRSTTKLWGNSIRHSLRCGEIDNPCPLCLQWPTSTAVLLEDS